jgi:hypothetical protein
MIRDGTGMFEWIDEHFVLFTLLMGCGGCGGLLLLASVVVLVVYLTKRK